MEDVFTALLRQATYFEALKLGAAVRFQQLTKDLDAEIRAVFQTAPETFAGMPRRDFNAFVAELRRTVIDTYQSRATVLVNETRKLIQAETAMYQRIFRADTGKRLVAPTNAELWAKVRNAINPATGLSFEKQMTAFRNSGLNLIEQAVRRGYADKLTAIETLTSIRGTAAAGYSNGVFRRINAWAGSMSNVAYSHAHSVTKDRIAARYYNEYEWVSILDEATTEICEDRHGEVYRYGEGPIPPAHYGCRSETVPVNPEDTERAESLVEWLEQQPSEYLSDLFKGGDRTLDKVKVITLDQFKDKLEIILV